MTYEILPYSRNKAKLLNVQIKVSTNPKKKIDVFQNGIKLCSIGASNYYDYPTYWREYGKEYAEKKRKLYKLRHEKDRHIIGSPGFFSDQILW